MNEELAWRVLQELIHYGVQEICICPGGRNAPFCFILRQNEQITSYYWHEERSASFFALGRSRATKRPVAIIVTSGTAAGELLPAAMEAHYSGVPLILVTADRPRKMRGSGAPQSAEQVGLYGQYAHLALDIEGNEPFSLNGWTQKGACHINVCLGEPISNDEKFPLHLSSVKSNHSQTPSRESFETFLQKIERPLVMVSTLREEAKDAVQDFLLKLNAPVYLEGVSQLRESPKLQELKVYHPDYQQAGFDSIIRIGGIPTHRAWRDLEESRLSVFSISEMPFKGLSYGELEVADCARYFQNYSPIKQFSFDGEVKKRNVQFALNLKELLFEEPFSEPSLLNSLSELIPANSTIFLGNSMPIRNWDTAASFDCKNFQIEASRGLNGIDGQLSCFLGLTKPKKENWAILGDLTTLYDLAAPWILPQLEAEDIKLVILNNYGGRIFARKFREIEIQNIHNTHFEHFAKLWQLPYERWEQVPNKTNIASRAIIELVSNFDATERFWKRYNELKKGICSHFH